MKRKLPELPGAPDPTVAVEVRPEPERVDFHFPIEIHMEQRGQPVDLEKVAEHVFDRLARRLTA